MDKISCSILIVIFWISSSEGASFITPYETTWDNATSNCTIDTPTISFDGSRKNLRVNYNLTGNDDVWVGYYLDAITFNYIGCVKEENLTPSAEFDHNTPGFCYSACNKTKFIGVSEKKCFCFNDTIPHNKFGTTCTKGCRDQEYIACGGNDSISMYTVDSPDIYNGTGDCLLYQKNNASDPIRSWSFCNQTNQIICTYTTATKPKKFGFLNRKTSSSTTLLKFTTKTNMKKHALCKNGASEKSTSATTSGLGVSVSISPQSSTAINFTISPTNNSTMKRSKNIKFSDFAIPIGVSISIFLIIVGAVIAVKVTKRRGKMPVVFCNISPSDTTPKRTNDTPLIINNAFECPSDSPYEQIDKVKSRTSKAAVNDVQVDNGNYTQVNLDLENNATKSISDMAHIRVDQDKGVYNTLNFHGGSFDDTYDTLEKAAN